MKKPKFLVSREDRKLINSILTKIEIKKRNLETQVMSFSQLFNLLTEDEVALIKRFKNINPRIYGFKGRFLGIQKVPKNLVKIKNQKYKREGKSEKIEAQYLPKPVYLAYKKLNQALHRDIGKRLLIDSGYRSSANQVTSFLWYLNFYKFNFLKTVRRVAIAGYSEHGFSRGQALDFITTNGIPNDERPMDFEKTIEYSWLMKNADKFGFYQSYPRNNGLGIMFEPWHWALKRKP